MKSETLRFPSCPLLPLQKIEPYGVLPVQRKRLIAHWETQDGQLICRWGKA